MLREYARHVVKAEALDASGKPLAVEKVAHNVWRCHAPGGGHVTLRLSVYALDQSVRGAWLDTRQAWFNGPCLFALPKNHADADIRLTIEVPQAPLDAWQVATAMTPLETDANGFGQYSAADYDELLDHPVLIGQLDRVDFACSGVPHSVVVVGAHDGNLERVGKDLQRICTAQIEFFGKPPPFDRYQFLCVVVADGYGGLEHRYSSMLMFARRNLPYPGADDVAKDYQRMLSLASHEYFHTWHVKRTMPAAFMPYRLTERNFTRLLWVFEGITSYYQDRFLLRSGLIDEQTYLNRLAELISNVLRMPGRHLQSLAESSFDAWDKLYKPNENSPNAGISYYSKGALVSLALDLEIRRRRNSEMSLDTVVQAFWREFGAQDIGVPEDGFEVLAKRLVGNELGGIFDSAIRGTQDPPLAELFTDFGIEFEPSKSQASPWLGIIPKAAGAGIECTTVLDDGPAGTAGLNPGDIIVAVDRKKVTLETLEALLRRYEIGTVVPVSFFRGDELLEFPVTTAAAPTNAWRLRIRDDAAAGQRTLRDAWLAG